MKRLAIVVVCECDGCGEYEEDASGGFYLASAADARIAELESVLRKLLANAREAPAHANDVLVHRSVVGEARKALGL